MVNYKLGKIYKIVCHKTGQQYIGSTCERTLARRLAGHRTGYNYYLKHKINSSTSYIILEQGNYEIVLIENFPCNTKDELHARECHHIQTNVCVNVRHPLGNKPNWKEIRINYNKHKTEVVEVLRTYYNVQGRYVGDILNKNDLSQLLKLANHHNLLTEKIYTGQK